MADQAFLRAPRDLQEPSKRPPGPIWEPFWSHFGTISRRCCHHVGHVSSLNAPSPRALHPRSQAMFVGVPWPRALDPTPQARRNARERLNKLPQNSSWTGQESLKTAFFQLGRPPRRLQETSRAHFAPVWVPFGSNFAGMSMPCCHHVGHVSSLKAPSPRALDPRPQAWRNARERLNKE